MKIIRWVLILIIAVALVAGGAHFATSTTPGRALMARFTGGSQTRTGFTGAARTGADTDTITTTVPVQPASAIIKEVSASGHIELNSQVDVALAVGGIVQQVHINVGDVVTKGQLLVTLDTIDLERALRRAELATKTQMNKLDQLKQQTTAADIALAEANLESAKADLADAKAGPNANELAAARSSVAAAWARYNDLLAGPSQDALTQLSADIKKKEIALANAQRTYDRVAWRNDVGMTNEAASLQQATIDHESSKAAYQEQIKPASTADLQSALSTARQAQKNLDDLLKKPTAADIAAAEAKLVDAETTLTNLKAGPDAFELTDAQLALEKALVDLEEAHANLANAKVLAPMDGAVLAVNAQVGERAGQGTVIVTLANAQQLKLTIDVAEVDISQITQGLPAQILIDAFPGQVFMGEVSYIAPTSSGTSGLINYPVTVRLIDQQLTGVRPGMTAVATIANTQTAAPDDWLVPTNAIRQQGGDTVVTVVHGEARTPIKVIPGAIQGEWTLVKSAELQAGDQVAGSVTTKINNNQFRFGPPGAGRGPGGGPGGQNRPAP